MRTIKFRVWERDTDEKQTPIEMRYCQDFKECASVDENYGNLSVWMQFTGLKDKNGNDIYEGDILNGTLAGVGYIKWTNACFHIFREHQGVRHAALSLKVAKSLTIIGNIFEHPNLLKRGGV